MLPRLLTVLFLFLVFIASLSSTAWASALDPEYSISVTEQSMSVSLNLSLSQNLTAFEKTFTLPQGHGTIQGSNSTSATDAIQNALRAKSPRAQVDNLGVTVDSTGWSNQTSMQWFNISLTMEVAGLTFYNGGSAQVDLSWRSFTVLPEISVGGIEVNRIGEEYMMKVASDLVQVTESPNIFFSYFTDNTLVDPTDFQAKVRDFKALNFSSLAVPISQWQLTYEPLANTRSWTLNTGQTLGVKFLQRIQEAREVTSILFGVLYSANGKIVAPGSSSALGDTLKFPVDSFPETLMGVAILSSGLVGVGALVYERRILKRPEIRKRAKR